MSEIDDDWTIIPGDGFFDLIGPVYHRIMSPQTGRFRFFADEKHRNRSGTVHGGLLMSLADRAMGATARQSDPDRQHATVQLDMHFVNAAAVGVEIEIECRIVRETRHLVFIDAILSAGDKELATARGIWKVFVRGAAPARAAP